MSLITGVLPEHRAPEGTPAPKRASDGIARPASTRVAAAAVLLVTAAGLALPDPVCLLIGVIGAATLLFRQWLPIDAALPVATVTAVVAAVLLGLAADVADLDLLGRPAALGALWTVVVGACVVAAMRRGAAVGGLPVRSRLFVLAQLPAAVACAVALLQQMDISHVAAWIFYGTDFSEHAVLLEGVQRSGSLDYGAEVYPRGAQALLALLSVPGLPESGTAALLSYDLRLLGAATWLAFGLLLWSMTALVLRLGDSIGLPESWTVAAALVLGILIHYHSGFTAVFVVMASAPGLLAAVTALLVPLVVLSSPAGRSAHWTAIVTVLSVVALAHLWPALATVPLAAWASALVRRDIVREVRQGLSAMRTSQFVLGGMALVVLGVAAAVPVLALLGASGLATAAVAGALPAPPLALTAAGIVAAVALSWRYRSLAVLVGATLGAGATVVTLLVGAGAGFDLGQYYPRKGTWFLVVLVLPVAAVSAAVICRVLTRASSRALSRLGPAVRVARAIAVAVLVALLGAYGLPALLQDGSLAGVAAGPAGAANERRIGIAMEHGHKYAPAVTVPIALDLRLVPRSIDTYVLSKLLRFKTGQPATFGDQAAACTVLRDVARDAPAVVITDLDEDVLAEVMRRQGCPGTRIVQIPGGDPNVLKLSRQRVEDSAS